MDNIHALITVRMSSTRLGGKCMLLLYDGSVLEHVIKRVRAFGMIPVISTTREDWGDDSLTPIERTAKRLGVLCYCGPNEDKLLRWKETCDKFNIDKFVTVDCDDPYFDDELSRLAYDALSHADVVKPNMHAYLGSHGWALRKSAIDKSCKTKKSSDTEMMWYHLDSSLVIVGQRPPHLREFEQGLRLTLDYEEDYWLLKTVSRHLKFDCTRDDIVRFFEANPGLRKINDFRNEAWKQGQEKR